MQFQAIICVVFASLYTLSLSFGQEGVIDTIEITGSQVQTVAGKRATVVLADDSPKISAVIAANSLENSFPAPKANQPPLTNVKEVIDAFLAGTTWQQQLPLIFNSDSVKEDVKAYYNEHTKFGDYKAKLFQMELSPEWGGPFWVFRVSRTKDSKGFPVVVRKENENLKIDWNTFSEFSDKHFVRFIDGKKKGPAEFRLIVEPLEKYSGPDRDGFTDLDRYDCYKLFPPYGDYEEFTEYAFVEKDSAVAYQLAKKFNSDGLPLAMVVELNIKSFKHGIRHSLITDVITEGWLIDPVEADE